MASRRLIPRRCRASCRSSSRSCWHRGSAERARGAPRVMSLLDGAGGPALALLSAPTGYGKTTAVRAWCADRGEAFAWITLDAGDNDPLRLWTYVATGSTGSGRDLLVVPCSG